MDDNHNQPSSSKGGHAPNPSAAPPYELTASAGGGPADAAGALVPAQTPHQPHSPQSSRQSDSSRKRKEKHYSSDGFDMSTCDGSYAANTTLSSPPVSRKRKGSYGAGSAYDDDGGEDSKCARTGPDKKQNHSEIEKRRRDKMNKYITELSTIIPMCGAMARKLDKLTVLRMAVQHLRSVRGALSAGPLAAVPRPAFLSEPELNELVLLAARNCFLLVVGCDRGRLLYVSASVKRMLQYDQIIQSTIEYLHSQLHLKTFLDISLLQFLQLLAIVRLRRPIMTCVVSEYERTELLGQSLFDILHPKDVAKVKEQLSSSDLSPRERLIDAKTMLPVKADLVAGVSRLCPGARRSFFCRIKSRSVADQSPAPVKQEDPAKIRKKTNGKKYCVVQCTGYLKLWASAEASELGGEGGEEGDGSLSCLVALGRALPDLAAAPPAGPPPPCTRRLQFVSRHAPDGKYVFVDQRVTLALGFLPQELLGTSLYEYVGAPELGAVARTHKAALLDRHALHTPPYAFRRKDGSRARLQTHFKPFKNPWTKEVECLVANNTILSDSDDSLAPDAKSDTFDSYKHKSPAREASVRDFESGVSEPDLEMQRLIDSQVESHNIGSAIADEALRRSSPDFSPELPVDLLQEAVFGQSASLMDNILGVDLGFGQVRNNVSLSAAGGSSPAGGLEPLADESPPPGSPPLPALGLDGNSEAAMAVIMSLLEADVGLGGPINIPGLPWPLP